MKLLAPGVHRLGQFPRPVMNVYLAEDVLIDAGTAWDRHRIMKQLKGVDLSMVALTHVHPDHQGVARDVCLARDIPLACHADDVDAMEGRVPVSSEQTTNPLVKRIQTSWEGPSHRVSRILNEGDEIAGFRVIHAPGHAKGEVIYFRESDRVAICGDVIRNMSYATTLAGIAEPPEQFTYDPQENRRSIRKLADLNPTIILPGHGPEVTDMRDFKKFVEALPD